MAIHLESDSASTDVSLDSKSSCEENESQQEEKLEKISETDSSDNKDTLDFQLLKGTCLDVPCHTWCSHDILVYFGKNYLTKTTRAKITKVTTSQKQPLFTLDFEELEQKFSRYDVHYAYRYCSDIPTLLKCPELHT